MPESRPPIGHPCVLTPSMGAQLLEALGLKDRPVLRLSLHFEAGEISRIEWHEICTDEQTAAVLPVLRQFALVERHPAASQGTPPDTAKSRPRRSGG